MCGTCSCTLVSSPHGTRGLGMWKWRQEEGSRQLSGEGCHGGTVRTGTDGEGWSCSVYLLLLTPPARAFSCAAWPACSGGFSIPVLVHPGCGASAAPEPLPPCGDQGLPMSLAQAPLSQLALLARCPSAQRSWKPIRTSS